MPGRRVVMVAVGALAVIAVASTSALVTLALARGGPNVLAVAAPTSASEPASSTPLLSRSSSAPTPPASLASPTTATTTMAPKPTPAARVPADPPTKVQITRWGVEKTPPKETLKLGSGGCTESNLLLRQDAWRCFTNDNGVADPCFGLDTGLGLMCPAAPWSTVWTLISAEGNSGNTDPPTTKGPPWGVEIASGVRCIQASGATGIISGLRGSYYCPDDSWLYGDPTRGSTWHIKLSSKSNGPLHTVALRKVWF